MFGNGHLAELAFHALELAKVSVIGICDDDPGQVGREWCGCQVLSPSQISYMAPDAVVIVKREKTTEICDSLTELLDREIRVLRLDGGGKNEIGQPEANVETAAQAVTGRQ